MKKCPFCAEDIQDEAVKCRYCGEYLLNRPSEKWYFKTSILVISILTIGPFALPLLWRNPRYSRLFKTITTVVILILSWSLFRAMIEALRVIREYYDLAFPA